MDVSPSATQQSRLYDPETQVVVFRVVDVSCDNPWVKNTLVGKVLPIPEGESTLGRGTDCGIFIDEDTVSRQHCVVRLIDSELHLIDTGSVHGVVVRGESCQEVNLSEGAIVVLGNVMLQVEVQNCAPTRTPLLRPAWHRHKTERDLGRLTPAEKTRRNTRRLLDLPARRTR